MKNSEFINSISDVEREMMGFYLQLHELHKAKNILEVGSGWGLFTRFCMMASTDSKVITIDKIPEPRDFSKNTEGFEERITRIINDSKNVLKTMNREDFDVVMIDGDHGYNGFREDFIDSWHLVKAGGLIIVDDVWHEHNFDDDYGITMALSELAHEYKFEITIYPYGHGIGLIKKL